MAQAETIPLETDLDPAETAEWLESLQYVLETKGPERVRYLLSVLDETAYRPGGRTPLRHQHPLHQHHSRRSAAAIPGQPRDRAADQEHHPLERDGHGRRGPTTSITASAGIFRRTPRPPRCTKSPSTISSAARATTTRATSFISRGTPRRAFTPGLSRRPADRSSNSRTSGRNWPPGAGCRAIRTRG